MSARSLALLAAAALLACDDGVAPGADGGDAVCVVTVNAPTRFPGVDPAGAPPRIAYSGAGVAFDAVYLSSNGGAVATPWVARVDAAVGALVAGPRLLSAAPAQSPWIAPSLGDGAGTMVGWVSGASPSLLVAQRLDPSNALVTRASAVVAVAAGDARLRQVLAAGAGYAFLWNPDPTRLDLDATDPSGAMITMNHLVPPDSPTLLDAAPLAMPSAGPDGGPGATSFALLLPWSTGGDALLNVGPSGARVAASMPLTGTASLASEVLVWTGTELRVLAIRTGAGTGNAQLTLARFSATGALIAPALMLVGALPDAPSGDARALGAAWDGAHVWVAWNDHVLGAALGRVRDDGAGVTDVRRLGVTGAALNVGWLALGGNAFAVGAVDAAAGPVVVTGSIACAR